MALDKLVDSTLLDAACTYEAEKIREKLGSSAQIAYDLANGKGFGDAIAAIPSGGDPNAELRKLVDNSLTSFIDETITLLPAYAFYGKSSLATLQCHNVTSVGGGWLGGANAAGSPAVEAVALPKVTSIGGNGSNNNRNIKKLDFTALTSIGIYGFATNQALNVLVLRKDGVVELNGINAFSDTPFASGKAGGTLYVPQGQISAYQSASNWSTILGYANNSIAKIEGSIYETTYVDGTTIPT